MALEWSPFTNDVAFFDVPHQLAVDRHVGLALCDHIALERLGAWGQPVAHSPTLREALSSFCRLYARDVSLVELGLSADANELWLWRRRAIEPAVRTGCSRESNSCSGR